MTLIQQLGYATYTDYWLATNNQFKTNNIGTIK